MSQNPLNKIKMCAWCEYRQAETDGALCKECKEMRPLWRYLAGDLNN